MPQVKKQQYTRPIPEGAARTDAKGRPLTVTVRRRGKDVVVPAVKVRGAKGKLEPLPIVQSGKGAGTHYLAESKFFYGLVHGKPVKPKETQEASETLLGDLIRQADLGSVVRGDPFAAHKKRPLSEHIDDFAMELESRDSGAEHVQAAVSRGRRALVDGCGFSRLSDLDAAKVVRWLRSQREGAEPAEVPADRESFTIQDIAAMLGLKDPAVAVALKALGYASGTKGKRLRVGPDAVRALLERRARGVSDATANHYHVSLRSFGRWLGGKGRRLPANPFADLTKIPVLSRRHARRELPTDQIRLLLATAAASRRAFRGIDGPSRSLLYATACGTGFRAGGLAALTPECFHLGGPRPTITLPVRADKVKRGKVQPIPADLAEALRPFLEGRPRGVAVWPGTWSEDGAAANMLRADLKDAGIPAVLDGPDGPEHADFHALRHSYLTAHGRSGVDLRVQQELAGHSSPLITARYSHVRLHDLGGAVDKLPATLGAYVQLTFAGDSRGLLPMTPDGDRAGDGSRGGEHKSKPGKAMDCDGVFPMASDGGSVKEAEEPAA